MTDAETAKIIEAMARALCLHGEFNCWKTHTSEAKAALDAANEAGLSRAVHNAAIEECLAILRPVLMQDENLSAATVAGRYMEKMRALVQP